jgi:hypothetical protein
MQTPNNAGFHDAFNKSVIAFLGCGVIWRHNFLAWFLWLWPRREAATAALKEWRGCPSRCAGCP